MNQMTLCLLIFALMIVLFFIKKIPMSFSAMLIVVLLVKPAGLLGKYVPETV